MIADLTARRGVVVATGGGAVLDATTRARLVATGTVVYLQANVDSQLKRTQATRNRPLLLDEDRRRPRAPDGDPPAAVRRDR